jgi:hypothetical protein
MRIFLNLNFVVIAVRGILKKIALAPLVGQRKKYVMHASLPHSIG